MITRHLSGELKRKIARSEGIGRDTVGRILSQQEVVEAVARYQSRLLDMVAKAIDVYDRALASDDLHLATATATKLLEGMQVLHKGGFEQTLQMANRASPETKAREVIRHPSRFCVSSGDWHRFVPSGSGQNCVFFTDRAGVNVNDDALR